MRRSVLGHFVGILLLRRVIEVLGEIIGRKTSLPPVILRVALADRLELGRQPSGFVSLLAFGSIRAGCLDAELGFTI